LFSGLSNQENIGASVEKAREKGVAVGSEENAVAGSKSVSVMYAELLNPSSVLHGKITVLQETPQLHSAACAGTLCVEVEQNLNRT
jgi:hypothetical protein